VTEASDSGRAQQWRSSVSQKLANAKGTAAVQKVSVDSDGTIVFSATVDFSPTHVVTPGPTGFPPAGAVLNAPQLSNTSGTADKVVAIGPAHQSVRYKLTDGVARGNAVVYVSTESSDPGAAAIEDVTFAPTLNAAPFAGGDGTNSARSTLAAFTNGATGRDQPATARPELGTARARRPPQRPGLDPNQGRYSPLWDVHLSTWAPGQAPTRQSEVAHIADLAAAGKITGFPSGPWVANGFIVNCPIIAQR
jgi:hypothetical protein